MGGACVRCGEPLPQRARFCPNCGHSVEAPDPADEDRHRRLAAAAPPALAEKMRVGLLMGERKPVTALFADVVGSTSILETTDPEEWTSVLNRAFSLMSTAVYHYEGTIAHLLGDGLLAFFGAPVAHEDDPERAVRSGLEMIELLQGLRQELLGTGIDFQVRVGINTGTAVVGEVGSDLRYEYTAIGDAVNVAARIQAAAEPGTLLISDATYRFVAPKFEVQPLGPLALKGKSDRIPAFRVVGPALVPGSVRGLAGFPSPLVGREDALAALVGVVTSASEGRGATALVLGEPGVGKTRLLRELRMRAPTGALWAEGRCLSFGRGLPYHLLVDLLRSVLTSTRPDLDPHAALRSVLEPLAEAERGEARRYLAHLLTLPLEAGEEAAIAVLVPEVRHQRLIGAIGSLLRVAALGGPLVLVCEDAHWADAPSIDALTSLLPLVRDFPLVLVVSSRPDPDAPGARLAEAARVVLGGAAHVVELSPLSEQDSRALVTALLEIESLPSELRRLILERAEGNPFFLEEVVRMLLDTGLVVRQGDRWVGAAGRGATADGRTGIPETLNGLLVARIDRLSSTAKHAARVASVIGREFSGALLAAVLQEAGTANEVDASLAELEAHDLVRRSSPGPVPEYAFRHALVQDAAYASLLRRDRQRLHGAVGRVLERLIPAPAADRAAVLALHFEQAGDVERAVDYLIDAGEDALRRFAPRSAYDFFGRALAHLEHAGDEPHALRKRVRAGLGCAVAGYTFVPFDEVLALLEGLLPSAEVLGDPFLLAQVHEGIVRARQARGEVSTPELIRSVTAAEQIAASLGDDRLRAVPLSLRALRHFASSDYRTAGRLFAESVPLLERHATVSEAGYSAGLAAISFARLGDFTVADEWVARAVLLAEASGDPNAVLDADIHRSLVESARGNLEEAIALSRRGTELAEQVDNKACALVGHFVAGDQHLRAGRPEAALRSLERSAELAEYCDVADVENLSQAWLSAARLQLGATEEGLRGFDAPLEKARQIGDRLGEAEILRQRAMVHAKADQRDDDVVARDFTAAIRIFEELGTLPYLARALRDYGLFLSSGRRLRDAGEMLRRAAGLFAAMQLADLSDAP